MTRLAASNVRAALQRTYGPPESVIFFEVANGTGSNARRWADAVSMGCWPSRGMLISGFEIKVSKYDWRKEKAAPAKAEAIAQYCDHWWLATTAGVVEDLSEIPDTWGWLLLAEDGKLTTRKQPVRMEPRPLDRNFVASLLRSSGKIDQGAINAAVENAVRQRTQALEEQTERRIKDRVASVTHEAQEIAGRYQMAETVLGPSVRRYLGDADFLAAVRLVLELGVARTYHGLSELRDQMARTVERFDAAAVDLKLPTQADMLRLDDQARDLKKAAR